MRNSCQFFIYECNGQIWSWVLLYLKSVGFIVRGSFNGRVEGFFFSVVVDVVDIVQKVDIGLFNGGQVVRQWVKVSKCCLGCIFSSIVVDGQVIV